MFGTEHPEGMSQPEGAQSVPNLCPIHNEQISVQWNFAQIFPQDYYYFFFFFFDSV